MIIEYQRRALIRRGSMWTAKAIVGDVRFECTAPTKKEAGARLKADIDYVQTQGELCGAGFRLYAHGFEEWCLQWPHKSGSAYCFGAKDLAAALAHVVKSYHDHEQVQAFVREAST